MNISHGNLHIALRMSAELLLSEGKLMDTSSWQGKTDLNGGFTTYEIINHSFTAPIPEYLVDLKETVKPNLPWADLHFEERVSGIPWNPPPSYKLWPFWRESSEETKEVGGVKFSHSYPERYWPKRCELETGNVTISSGRYGIHYPYGDLNDVVNLLLRDRYTRQAVLPVFFPEDTGAVQGQRVPCSLSYCFLLRDNKLHIFYTIRSCDCLRHFKDDVYLTCRLLLWMLESLKSKDPPFWVKVTPGNLAMQIYSLHMFKNDRPILEYQLKGGKLW